MIRSFMALRQMEAVPIPSLLVLKTAVVTQVGSGRSTFLAMQWSQGEVVTHLKRRFRLQLAVSVL